MDHIDATAILYVYIYYNISLYTRSLSRLSWLQEFASGAQKYQRAEIKNALKKDHLPVTCHFDTT
jgi:hypothetical protein